MRHVQPEKFNFEFFCFLMVLQGREQSTVVEIIDEEDSTEIQV